MPDLKIRLGVLGAFLLAILIGGYFYLTSGAATLPETAEIGPTPQITEPDMRLVPSFKVPKAVGWADGAAPTAAPGLKVKAFAAGLDHPRWMLVLPNGDVLVAETAAPPRKGGGIRGWIESWMMSRAGANVPSANRITLLRDSDGDGVADQRSVLLSGLNSPFGMALVGGQLYVADNDALLRFPFTPGQTHIAAKPVKVLRLPAGGRHWTRNVVAPQTSRRRSPLDAQCRRQRRWIETLCGGGFLDQCRRGWHRCRTE